jgi:glycosyltransferase involved in cell wall biosynthesis
MKPTISVVIPAYNAERWIGETLEAVFAQTDPADEVVVVDDGSTDGTLKALGPWRDRVVVIEQPNAGCGMAFNTAIASARSDFVALCPADDLWVPEKLAWQRATLAAHPEVDVSFGGAVNFGGSDAPFARPAGEGVLDGDSFLHEMFDHNVIPDPSVVLRKTLHARLGGFVAAIGEDYEFWLRALRAGAVFHFDPRLMVRLRQHGGNLSSNALAIWEMNLAVHREAAASIDDQAEVDRVLARDLTRVARGRLGLNRVGDAREAYRASLRHRVTPAGVAGTVALALPGARPAVRALNARRRPAP